MRLIVAFCELIRAAVLKSAEVENYFIHFLV